MRFIYLLLLFCPLFLSSQKPTLVVQIVVENLRSDVLQLYWNKFSDKGFKKLIDSGVYYTNAYYDYFFVNSASSYATLSTGTYPANHGIVGQEWINKITFANEYCVENNEYKTLFSSEKGKAPTKLNALSWSDQLRLFNFKSSKVFSVAIKDYAAILSAGKLANAAFWYDYLSGNFVTSTYYKYEKINWIEEFNNKKFSEIYINRTWNTSLDISVYKESLSDDNSYESGFDGKKTFPYNLSQLRTNYKNYELLLYTPFSNTLVKDFAVNLILNEYLGKDPFVDFLTVSFSAQSFALKFFNPKSLEIQDIYIKLDEDIGHFISFLESYVGKENLLIILTSDKGFCENSKWLSDINIPTSSFEPNKAILLANTYLRAVFGLHDWIAGFSNNQIYFNHFVADKNNVLISDLAQSTAKIINAMEGVAAVYTANSDYFKVKNSYNSRNSGDLYIDLKYGVYLSDKKNNQECVNSNIENSHVPLVFYTKDLKPFRVYRRVSMDALAVTLSFFFNIQLPSHATGEPLYEILTKNN